MNERELIFYGDKFFDRFGLYFKNGILIVVMVFFNLYLKLSEWIMYFNIFFKNYFYIYVNSFFYNYWIIIKLFLEIKYFLVNGVRFIFLILEECILL